MPAPKPRVKRKRREFPEESDRTIILDPGESRNLGTVEIRNRADVALAFTYRFHRGKLYAVDVERVVRTA